MDFRKEVVVKEKLHLNLAKLRKGGLNFEVNVDPDAAIRFIEGERVPVEEVILAEDVFFDAQKGEIASGTKLQELFGTDDTLEIAGKILQDGEIQFTAEYRQKLREQKRKRIIETIRKYGVDPRTKAPHPLVRIENALTEAKIKIDEKQPVDKQVKDIIRKLQPILPIRFEEKKIEIHVPEQFAGKCVGSVREMGTLKKEQWNTDGSWTVVIEIPGGLEEDLYNKLNSLTKGTVQTRILGE